MRSTFFRAFNAILSKVSRSASEETILALIRAKCLPILLYATEVCPTLARDRSSLEFTSTRRLMKLFHTGSAAIIAEFQRYFNFPPMHLQIILFALQKSSTNFFLLKINYFYYLKKSHHVN